MEEHFAERVPKIEISSFGNRMNPLESLQNFQSQSPRLLIFVSMTHYDKSNLDMLFEEEIPKIKISPFALTSTAALDRLLLAGEKLYNVDQL